MLNRKIKSDFLEISRNNIKLELAKVPIAITYDVVLATYRNAVKRKFPPSETPQANNKTPK